MWKLLNTCMCQPHLKHIFCKGLDTFLFLSRRPKKVTTSTNDPSRMPHNDGNKSGTLLELFYLHVYMYIYTCIWVRIPPESPVKFFQRHSEITEYTVLYTRRCRAKLKSVVYHPTQELTNLYIYVSFIEFLLFLYCNVHYVCKIKWESKLVDFW